MAAHRMKRWRPPQTQRGIDIFVIECRDSDVLVCVLIREAEKEVLYGDVYKRFAVQNLDWDHMGVSHDLVSNATKRGA